MVVQCLTAKYIKDHGIFKHNEMNKIYNFAYIEYVVNVSEYVVSILISYNIICRILK